MSGALARREALDGPCVSDQALETLSPIKPRRKIVQVVRCEWCGRPFRVELGGRGQPRRYCDEVFDHQTRKKGRVASKTCSDAAAAWRLVESWFAAQLEDLADDPRARDALLHQRERLMDQRKAIRDPQTGRLL